MDCIASLITRSVLLAALASPVFAQVQGPGPSPTAPGAAGSAQAATPVRPDYVLGANDQIIIRTPQVADMNDRPFRIDADGFIDLPLVGRVRAAGLSIQALESDLVNRLKEYVRSPQVFITLAQLRSEPVFLVGAFRAPGIYPLTGRKTLVEVLTSAGGIAPNASRRIRVMRRSEYGKMPLPNAVESADGKTSTVEISLESLSQNINPEEDILLQPYDIVSAEQAERVYVSGEVARAASIEFGERSSISMAQALTEAGGFAPGAKRDQVRVLRPITGTNRRAEIVVDANRIFAGKDKDFALLPNDVVFVPSSLSRKLRSNAPVLIGSLPYILATVILGATR